MRVLTRAAIVAGSALMAGSLLAGERVRVDGRCVDIHATAAPLGDLLAELARGTGMQLAFEGARPGQPITVDVTCGKPAAAVLGVLEGQGLDYVLQMSPDGARIDRLVLIAHGTQTAPVASGERLDEPTTFAEPVEVPEEVAAEKLSRDSDEPPVTVVEGAPVPRKFPKSDQPGEEYLNNPRLGFSSPRPAN